MEVPQQILDMYDKENQIVKFRNQLRKRNSNVDYFEVDLNKRSSKINQISKFIARLKKIQKEEYQQILQEMETLNLTKYQSEIAIHLCTLLKYFQTEEKKFYLEFITNMNCSYPDFAQLYFNGIVKQISDYSNPDEEKSYQRRNIISFLFNLYLCGLQYQLDKVLEQFRNTVVNKDENIIYLNSKTMVEVAYFFNEDIFGVKSKNKTKDWKKYEQLQYLIEEYDDIVDSNKQQKLYKWAGQYLIKLQNICTQWFSIYTEFEVQKKKKNVTKQEQDQQDSLKSKFKTLKQNLFDISNSLNIDLKLDFDKQNIVEPKVEAPKNNPQEQLKIIEKNEVFLNDSDQIMYESLIDLQKYVPQILLMKRKNVDEENKNEVVNTSEYLVQNYEQFIDKIKKCDSINQADLLAQDFCYINRKDNRKALIYDFLEYRKDFNLLLLYLCRIIATLQIYYKDLSDMALEKVTSDFNRFKQTEKTDNLTLEKKMRNVKSIAELTKFKIISTGQSMNFLRTLIEDFSQSNIQLICSFIENAGRFLYLNKESNMRFLTILDFLNNQKKQKKIPAYLEIQINSAIAGCKPVEIIKVEQKKRSLEQEYIRWLIFNLSKDNFNLTTNCLLTLPSSYNKYVAKVLLKIALKGKIEQTQLVSGVVKCLKDYYPQICLIITDTLIERILQNMEINQHSERQNRIRQIHFLGELYNFGIINNDVLLCILYKIINYKQFKGVQIDNDSDYFRVVMACTLLQSVKDYINTKKNKLNMARFILFFQLYIFQKSYIPMLLEFTILDTLDLFEQKIKLDSINQAQFIAEKIVQIEQNNKIENYQEVIEMYKEQKVFNQQKQENERKFEDQEKKQVDQLKKFDDEFQQMIDQGGKTTNTQQIQVNRNENEIIQKKKNQKKEEGKPTMNFVQRQGNKVIQKEIQINKQI